jgi:hypothetical protein
MNRGFSYIIPVTRSDRHRVMTFLIESDRKMAQKGLDLDPLGSQWNPQSS